MQRAVFPGVTHTCTPCDAGGGQRRCLETAALGDVRVLRFMKCYHAAASLDVCCCESASTWALCQHPTDFTRIAVQTGVASENIMPLSDLEPHIKKRVGSLHDYL